MYSLLVIEVPLYDSQRGARATHRSRQLSRHTGVLGVAMYSLCVLCYEGINPSVCVITFGYFIFVFPFQWSSLLLAAEIDCLGVA